MVNPSFQMMLLDRKKTDDLKDTIRNKDIELLKESIEKVKEHLGNKSSGEAARELVENLVETISSNPGIREYIKKTGKIPNPFDDVDDDPEPLPPLLNFPFIQSKASVSTRSALDVSTVFLNGVFWIVIFSLLKCSSNPALSTVYWSVLKFLINGSPFTPSRRSAEWTRWLASPPGIMLNPKSAVRYTPLKMPSLIVLPGLTHPIVESGIIWTRFVTPNAAPLVVSSAGFTTPLNTPSPIIFLTGWNIFPIILPSGLEFANTGIPPSNS